MRKKILLIGMLNSIHLANWLERITDIEADILLFPSRQYKALHPKINLLMKNSHSISVVNILPSNRISVFVEFALDTRWLNFVTYFSRSARLKRILKKQKFDKIHAIEMQHAGYLLAESLPSETTFDNIIVTNWGSDIYYFSQFPHHAKRIRDCLKIANFYSAECKRDYGLAREYGFSGIELPLVPNSTTFEKNFFERTLSRSRDRSQIIMKCYGETFGLGELLLGVAETTLSTRNDFSIFAYSITPDLYPQAETIQNKYPERFKYATVEAPITHGQMIQEFEDSRIYIGASRSDGISTSFLEALATGAFPIQTSTSCAAEWIDSGAKGLIVEPTFDDIQKKLDKILMDTTTLEDAQFVNSEIAKTRLSFDSISAATRAFYL